MTFAYRARVLVLLPFLFIPFIAVADTAAAGTYLAAHAQNPWVTMALASAGQSPDASYITVAPDAHAIDIEAPMMALAAAGIDPRSYSGGDLVAQLEATYMQGQIGDPTLLNDDFFGLLALAAAGVSKDDSVVAGSVAFVLANQNADGGWAYNVGDTSDTNSTAAAIMALIASGTAPGDPKITSALAYLHAAQNADGGLPYDPKSPWGTASDASSDSWTIMALKAAGVDPASWAAASGTPLSDLATYQTSGGYFEYQHGTGEDSFTPVTTAYATLALLGNTLPSATITPPPPPPPPPAPAPAPSGGGGAGSYLSPVPQPLAVIPDAASNTSSGAVLGTSTEATSTAPAATSTAIYQFSSNLHYGMFSNDVAQLQARLISLGLLNIATSTGWFGPLTLKAVKLYQAQQEIPPTGFVGPLTRRALNAQN